MHKSPAVRQSTKAASAKALRKRQENERRVAAAKAAAIAEETRAEDIAPAIQRKAVLDARGDVVRHARVEPDGKAFKVANPVARLAKVSASITQEHQAAAARLVIAWEEGGKGVGLGASLYGERTSGASASGFISDRVLSVLRHQNRARAEFAAAYRWMGRLWAPVAAIVLEGADVSSWAASVGRDRKAAVGYVAGALDRLAEFYEALDAESEKRVAQK